MRQGMSAIGYAIVVVILVGVGMIISAPMMVDNYKNDEKTPKGGLADRVSNLEMRVNNLEDLHSEKYVCVQREQFDGGKRFVLDCVYK